MWPYTILYDLTEWDMLSRQRVSFLSEKVLDRLDFVWLDLVHINLIMDKMTTE